MGVIETRKLTKYYGKNRGIIDVDLDVEEGEIFGMVQWGGKVNHGKDPPYISTGGKAPFRYGLCRDSAKIKKQIGTAC